MQTQEILDELPQISTKGDVCEFFYVLPNREEYPDYYQVIQQPISLQEISAKKYSTMDEFRDDLLLMTDNAQQYNKQGSRVYKDAQAIATYVQQKLGGGRKNSLVIKLKQGGLARAYQKMANIRDGTYFVSGLFLELPSKRDYPYYYQVIQQPISLKEMKAKIDKGVYEKTAQRKNVDEAVAMEEDVVLMVKNAFTFNDPASDVCRDAMTILKEFRSVIGLPTPAGEDFSKIVPSPSKVAQIGMVEEQQQQQQQPKRQSLIVKVPKPVEDYLKTHKPIDFVADMEEVYFKRSSFVVGDFVYLANDDNVAIGVITKIFKNKQGRNRFMARWMLHPLQVRQAYAQKYGKNIPKSFDQLLFDPHELYLSDKVMEHGPMDITGRVNVVFVDEYRKGRFMGWNSAEKQKDVYFFEAKLIDSGSNLRIQLCKEYKDCLPKEVHDEELPAFIPFDKPKLLDKKSYEEIVQIMPQVLPSANRHSFQKSVEPAAEDVGSEEETSEEAAEEDAEETDDEYEDEDDGYRPPRGTSFNPQLSLSMPQMPQIRGMPPNLTPQQQQLYMQMMFAKFQQMQKQGSGAAQQRPGQAPGIASDHLPASFIEKFSNRQGKVLWYSAPPRVAPPVRQLHTDKYMKFLNSKKRKTMDVVQATRKKASVGQAVFFEKKQLSLQDITSCQDYGLLVSQIEAFGGGLAQNAVALKNLLN